MSSQTSLWAQHDFHGKVVDVLRRYPDKFLTAYQLAIEMERTFERGVDYPNWPVGGAGLGAHSSLTQYLAGELSYRIEHGEITEIESGRLSHRHISRLTFDENRVGATTLRSRDSQSIFRLR